MPTNLTLLIGSWIRQGNGRSAAPVAGSHALEAVLPSLDQAGGKRRIEQRHRAAKRRTVRERSCRAARLWRSASTTRPFLPAGRGLGAAGGLQNGNGQVRRAVHAANKVSDQVKAGAAITRRAGPEATKAGQRPLGSLYSASPRQMTLDDERCELQRLDAGFRVAADFLGEVLKSRQGVRSHRDQALGRPARVRRAPTAGRSLEAPAHFRCEMERTEVARLCRNTSLANRAKVPGPPGVIDLSMLHEAIRVSRPTIDIDRSGRDSSCQGRCGWSRHGRHPCYGRQNRGVVPQRNDDTEARTRAPIERSRRPVGCPLLPLGRAHDGRRAAGAPRCRFPTGKNAPAGKDSSRGPRHRRLEVHLSG